MTYETPRQLIRDVDAAQTRRDRISARSKIAMLRRLQYLEGTYHYCLFDGQRHTMEEKIMTGAQAIEANKVFEDEFHTALGRTKKVFLKRWKLLETPQPGVRDWLLEERRQKKEELLKRIS